MTLKQCGTSLFFTYNETPRDATVWGASTGADAPALANELPCCTETQTTECRPCE